MELVISVEDFLWVSYEHKLFVQRVLQYGGRLFYDVSTNAIMFDGGEPFCYARKTKRKE